MDVFLLRHGKAEAATVRGGDAERRLTKNGREDILAGALGMAAQGLEFDLIAASPFARAQETAAIVSGVLEMDKEPETWDVLVPGGRPDSVMHEIGRYETFSAILLVGHEPLLSSLISRIISGDENTGIVMTKGGLAKIRNFSFAGRPSGELHWLLTGKQLALSNVKR